MWSAKYLVDVIDEDSAGVVTDCYVMAARVPQTLVQRRVALTVRASRGHLNTNKRIRDVTKEHH